MIKINENLGVYSFSVEIESTSKDKSATKSKKIYTTLISKEEAKTYSKSLNIEINYGKRNLKTSYLGK